MASTCVMKLKLSLLNSQRNIMFRGKGTAAGLCFFTPITILHRMHHILAFMINMKHIIINMIQVDLLQLLACLCLYLATRFWLG